MHRTPISFSGPARKPRHSLTRLVVALACLLAPSLALLAQGPAASPALAVFNGEPILEEQLPSELLSQLRRMEQQVYLVRLRGLHEILDRQLVAAEAARQKVTPKQLIEEKIAAVPEPTDQQVKAYYDEHKAAINQPLEEASPGIRSILKNTALQSEGRNYTQSLFQEAINNKQLTMLLRPPHVDMEVDPKRTQGSSSAPVTIVEYSDFSCPYCSKANAMLHALVSRHPDQVRVGYRDFPLITLHPHAELAAEASRCAGDQDRYWPYHDVLFAHLGNQTHDDLLRYASDLKLDTTAFAQCLDSGKFRVAVERDKELGIRGGVTATPAFFVNGSILEGLQSEADFEGAIQRAQAMAQAKNTSAGKPLTSTVNP